MTNISTVAGRAGPGKAGPDSDPAARSDGGPALDVAGRLVRPWTDPVSPDTGREDDVDATELRSVQQPLKDAYREHPEQAMITLRAQGQLGEEDLSCSVATGQALAKAGRPGTSPGWTWAVARCDGGQIRCHRAPAERTTWTRPSSDPCSSR